MPSVYGVRKEKSLASIQKDKIQNWSPVLINYKHVPYADSEA